MLGRALALRGQAGAVGRAKERVAALATLVLVGCYALLQLSGLSIFASLLCAGCGALGAILLLTRQSQKRLPVRVPAAEFPGDRGAQDPGRPPPPPAPP